jgi:hypothetical protein
LSLGLYSASDRCVNLFGRVRLHARHHVAVKVERDPDGGMTEACSRFSDGHRPRAFGKRGLVTLENDMPREHVLPTFSESIENQQNIEAAIIGGIRLDLSFVQTSLFARLCPLGMPAAFFVSANDGSATTATNCRRLVCSWSRGHGLRVK